MQQNLPQNLLSDVFWSFSRGKFDTQEAFNAEVIQYQQDIAEKTEHWHPDAIAIAGYQQVCINYEGLDEEAEALDDKSLVIETDNPEGFTNVELLFLIHNAVTEELSKIDHCFFEGLSFDSFDEMPVYWLHQGS
jgi:hypothetical protein